MKKVISLIVAFVCTFALVGCFPENTVNIEFPFEPEDVAFIEIHHSSASLYAEDVVFKSQESITALYRQLESISYKEKDSDASRLHETTSFNFKLNDGSEYDLIYISYGVKDGRLTSSAGKFNYFTSSDIDGLWKNISRGLETNTADESK